MALFEERLESIGQWVDDPRSVGGALGAEALVQENASGLMLVVGKHLIAEFVDELIEAEVDFGLEFVVEKLFLDFGERILRGVVVQIQRVENVFHHGRLARFQAVIRQNPRHAHLDRKLNSSSHRHFEEKLPVPQLGQVAAVAQSLVEVEEVSVEVGRLVKVIDLSQPGAFQLLAHHRLLPGGDFVGNQGFCEYCGKAFALF